MGFGNSGGGAIGYNTGSQGTPNGPVPDLTVYVGAEATAADSTVGEGDLAALNTDLNRYLRLRTKDYVDGTSYQDATGTPVVSPDTDVGTTPVALAVPTGAKYLYLLGTATIRFGSNVTIDGTGTGKGYSIAPAYTWSPPIPVADAVAIYVRIDAASGTCSVHQMWCKQA